MKTLITGSGVEIKLYSSADELPIQRYTKFQSYLVSESSSERLLAKLERIKAFIEEKDTDSAKTETINAIACLNSIYSGVDYTSMAFACLVAQIGDKVVSDVSDSGLADVVRVLGELNVTHKEVALESDSVKKKSQSKLQNFFLRTKTRLLH